MVYPDEATLIEVGRIAIAAGRLDAELGGLWWQLAPDQVDEVEARTAPAGTVREKIRSLARQRLDDVNATPLVAFVQEVEEAQRERNEVLHSRWLLRGRDAMRPVGEWLELDESQREAYLDDWEREAKASDEWQRQPSRAMTLEERHSMEELVAIERRLRAATDVATRWTFHIASMRVAGAPPGWRGPSTTA